MIREGAALSLRLLCGCRARWIETPEGDRPRIYFANHTSHLDSLIVWSALPRSARASLRIVAARDYWDRDPVRRWLACRVFNAVLISRVGAAKSDNLLSATVACVEEGASVLFFPEGGRHTGPAIGEFRPGLWHLARALPRADFVPVWIENLGRALPKGELLPLPILSAVTFGAPVTLGRDEPKEDFLARARQTVCDLKEQGI